MTSLLQMKTNIAKLLAEWVQPATGLLLLYLLCSNIAAVEPAGWDFPQTGRLLTSPTNFITVGTARSDSETG